MLLCRFCSDLSRVPRLRDSSRRRTKQFHVVLSTWVADCISAGKLLDERSYQPRFLSAFLCRQRSDSFLCYSDSVNASVISVL